MRVARVRRKRYPGACAKGSAFRLPVFAINYRSHLGGSYFARGYVLCWPHRVHDWRWLLAMLWLLFHVAGGPGSARWSRQHGLSVWRPWWLRWRHAPANPTKRRFDDAEQRIAVAAARGSAGIRAIAICLAVRCSRAPLIPKHSRPTCGCCLRWFPCLWCFAFKHPSPLSLSVCVCVCVCVVVLRCVYDVGCGKD